MPPANIPFLSMTGKKKFGIFFCSWHCHRWHSGHYLAQKPHPMLIHPDLAIELAGFGINDFHGLVPAQLFNWGELMSVKGMIMMVVGGFQVGFGTRYAGMYQRSCHYGYIQPTVALFGCYLLFYGRRFSNGQLDTAFHLVTLKRKR